MSTRRALWLITLLGSLLALGCGVESEEETKGNGDGKADDLAKTKPIQVTKEMNGQEVQAKVGDTIEVRLAGNPTTGYQWKAVLYSRSCPVSNPEGDYIADEPEATGSGGTYLFKIKPDMFASGGTHQFEFAYFRSWEGAENAIEKFAFSLKVAPSSSQSPLPPDWCDAGTIAKGAPSYVDSADGKECEMPSVHCVTNDWSSCPQLSPYPPDWCSKGTIVKGTRFFLGSADGMECEMPSTHCVTKNWSNCPQLSPLPPDWCSGGTIVQGEPSFIDSADGMECQMPSVHCLTKDFSSCPQL